MGENLEIEFRADEITATVALLRGDADAVRQYMRNMATFVSAVAAELGVDVGEVPNDRLKGAVRTAAEFMSMAALKTLTESGAIRDDDVAAGDAEGRSDA